MKTALKLLSSIALLGAALYLLDWNTMKAALVELDPWILVLATAIMALEIPALGLRWYLLVNPAAPLPFREHFRRYLIATFLNIFTPAQISGDVYRFISLKDNTESRSALVALMFQERYLGLIGFMLFFVFCLMLELAWNEAFASGPGWLFVMIGGGFAAALLASPFLGRILNIIKNLKPVQASHILDRTMEFSHQVFDAGSPRQMAVLILLSLPGGILWTAGVMIVAANLDVQLSFMTIGMIAVLVDLIRLLPISIQGIGAREAAFAYFFTLFGYSAETGFVIGAVSYVIFSLVLVGSGIVGRMMPVHAGHQRME